VRVFISWSGDRSRGVAELLRDWLPDVINAVEPWMSSEDIEKGAVGLAEISRELNDCSFGIVCLTQENQGRAWINYEAGALSKSVGDNPNRVATLLIDITSSTEVTGPLSQFQATLLTLNDMKRLAQSLNSATESPRPPDRIDRVVERLWPDFEPKLAEALSASGARAPNKRPRSQQDVLDELLTLTREIARTMPEFSLYREQMLENERVAQLNARRARPVSMAQRQAVEAALEDVLGESQLRDRNEWAISWVANDRVTVNTRHPLDPAIEVRLRSLAAAHNVKLRAVNAVDGGVDLGGS
jgi:hypothetical protein